jgi:hypothetical protein
VLSTPGLLSDQRLLADIHALVYFYQLVSLNVAVNSYDNALLTLLVSNQFVEIKGCEYSATPKNIRYLELISFPVYSCIQEI